MKAKRASLTPREKKAMLIAQAGKCARGCGRGGPFIAEHTVPVALGNDQKPDCLLCVPCALLKTNGLRGDINTIAHVKRLREGRTQFDKRKEAGGSRIRGRGFDKSVSKRMNGEVVRRDR